MNNSVDYSTYNIGNNLLGESNSLAVNTLTSNLNNFFRAVVVNNNDPLKLGRVQVRVPSIHGTIPTNDNYVDNAYLPWATPGIFSSAGNDYGEFNPPVAGTRVFATFENGDPQYPIYFGGIPTKLGSNKLYKADQKTLVGGLVEINTDDYNTDIINGTEKVVFKSFKGATIIIDDFDGGEYIKIIDQAGQSLVLGNKGDMLPRRGNKLGTSSQGYIELSNNRGESIRITDGQVYIDGDETYINSKSVQIPNWKGGGTGGDYYTKSQTDTLLANKSAVFFEQPVVPYQVNDIWYNGTTVYKCINTKKNGSFNISDWEIDTSFTTPDQVETSISKAKDAIMLEVSSKYVTESYVDKKLNYEVVISSSQGTTFKNGNISTTLTAFVRQGNYDVSNQFKDAQFIWSRTSSDTESDIEWNRNHIGGSRSITITKTDLDVKATFTCELVDEVNTLNYIKSGLIELFDGYDAPTSTNEWVSMIRTNEAIIPSSGITYDSDNHAYKFNGTSSFLKLQNKILLKQGYTYEFVTNLSSYTEVQNILHSTEVGNSSIFNKIACAVAGHLTIKKDGFTLNVGNIRLNKKSFLSIRFVSEDNIEVYYNNEYAGSFVQSNWSSNDEFFTGIGEYCNGYIYSIRVYNRLLTPSEIQTNYNEDKSRFS